MLEKKLSEFIEKEIEESNNIDYLTGLRKGIKKRKDMKWEEKLYYSNIINYKLVKLRMEQGRY